MDIVVLNEKDGGAVITAVSPRAIGHFEERMGRGVKQFRCDEPPINVLEKVPQDWVIGDATNVVFLK